MIQNGCFSYVLKSWQLWELESNLQPVRGGYGGSANVMEYENCHFRKGSFLQTPLVSIPLRKHCKK